MSACIFFAADFNLPEKERPDGSILEIDFERGMVSDGNADDDYGLYAFTDFDGHTELPYAVSLVWSGFTPGRAEHLIEYIRAALEHCDRIELWHVWLTGFCEYDERPYRKTMTVPICDLTIDDIKTVCEFDVWPSDKARPTDVCLVITHER